MTLTVSNDLKSKREQIIEAAISIFLKDGYGQASMDEVAKVAAVSKATIYNHFKDKKELFVAAVTCHCDNFFLTIQDVDISTLETAAALKLIAQEFLKMVMSPEAIEIYHLMQEEWREFPELGPLFYASGPEPALEGLASYLGILHDRRILSINNPLLAADHFCSMLRGDKHYRCLLGGKGYGDAASLNAHIDSVISFFLKGYAL